jgi:CRP/FNR family transcriptional regulator, cyclic AMP receptor protein
VKDDSEGGRLRFLACSGWLAEEPAEVRARLGALGGWITLLRGEPLYEAGDEPTGIHGLGEGLLDLSVPLPGGEDVLIHRAPPGFWIGDGLILTGKKRVLSVRAATEARVFTIPEGVLRRSLARYPEDWVSLHRLTGRNAALAVTAMAEIIALPPRQRFACMLLRCMAPDGTVRATQEELGRMAGMSRVAFRRAFRELIAEAVVRTEYRTIRVLDRARLNAIAHEPRM